MWPASLLNMSGGPAGSRADSDVGTLIWLKMLAQQAQRWRDGTSLPTEGDELVGSRVRSCRPELMVQMSTSFRCVWSGDAAGGDLSAHCQVWIQIYRTAAFTVLVDMLCRAWSTGCHCSRGLTLKRAAAPVVHNDECSCYRSILNHNVVSLAREWVQREHARCTMKSIAAGAATVRTVVCSSLQCS